MLPKLLVIAFTAGVLFPTRFLGWETASGLGARLGFEVNSGQTAAGVRFISRGQGVTLFLTDRAAVLRLNGLSASAVVRLTFAGARLPARVEGLDPTPAVSHYFLGDDPAKWRTSVTHFRRVRFRDIYPGIDAVFYGVGRQFEYDFVVAPGADPGCILLDIGGADTVSIDERGDLVLRTSAGLLRQHRPRIYQEIGGTRRDVAGGYRLVGKTRAGFELTDYRTDLPLVIDPVLHYSTSFGGSGGDYVTGMALDNAGNVYVTGYTVSADFPASAGAVQGQAAGNTDVFVTKLGSDGNSIIFSTFLGGRSGDRANAIAVDASGNAYVTGTGSVGFPVTAGAFRPACCGAFVAKLSATGSALLYSTFLGSGESYGIAVDSGGNVFVAGRTGSNGFPTSPGAFQTKLRGNDDAFLVKLDSAGGAALYSTYLGGSNFDRAHAVALDSLGGAYVTGYTASSDYPVTAMVVQGSYGGLGDAFVTRVTPDGRSVSYSTFLGGGSADRGGSIVVDSFQRAYVIGFTTSANFPTTAAAYQRLSSGAGPWAFVAALEASGTSLVYSTYLGRQVSDDYYSGLGITLGPDGSVYLTGSTTSAAFPVTPDALQPSLSGGRDAFLAHLSASGSMLAFSTFLGGGSDDYARGIARDAAGKLYIAGSTMSSNFPTTSGWRRSDSVPR